MSEPNIRVRFAPSPTGPLHMGGVRTALYNYLFAKKAKGAFILRIEDTDQKRYVQGAEKYIIQALEWCGLEINEGPNIGGNYGPYRQSERKHLYKEFVDQLIKNDFAYYAFDSTDELEKMRIRLKSAKVAAPQYNAISRMTMKNSLSLSNDEVLKRLKNGDPYVVRIKVPRKEEIKIKDRIRGWVIVHSSNVDDKVLFKSDGMPTYHLANVVDDHLMKITHVIRGEEWLPSMPIHMLLYKYLGWENEIPEFAHLPLLLRPDGNGKLSKRDGDKLGFPVFPLEWKDPSSDLVSSGYREKGYFPESFINMLAFLGWNPGTTQELFTLDQLVASFSLERVGKAGAKFDLEKAHWYNQQYLRSKPAKELANLFIPFLNKNGINTNLELVEKVCELMKERATFISDMMEGEYFFVPPKKYDEKTFHKKWKENTPEIISKFNEILKNISKFKSSNLESNFKSFIESNGYSFGAVMPNLRLLITGIGFGPSIFEIMSLLGKDETTSRITNGIHKLSVKH